MNTADTGSLQIYTDGASRGNPGPAAWAFVLVKNGEVLDEDCGYLGESTNNTAEYSAIINALKRAQESTSEKITVYSDSELAVKQINRVYRTNKQHLADLRDTVYSLCRHFEGVEFSHVPRENKYIERCDMLCNRCLDTRGSKNV